MGGRSPKILSIHALFSFEGCRSVATILGPYQQQSLQILLTTNRRAVKIQTADGKGAKPAVLSTSIDGSAAHQLTCGAVAHHLHESDQQEQGSNITCMGRRTSPWPTRHPMAMQDPRLSTAKERTAAQHLGEWLAHIDMSDSSDTDEALDEPSRALLESFTDRGRRRKFVVCHSSLGCSFC